jgi:hypothetical protein
MHLRAGLNETCMNLEVGLNETAITLEVGLEEAGMKRKRYYSVKGSTDAG